MDNAERYAVEEALLGSVMMNPEQYAQVKDMVRPTDFAFAPFGWAWDAIGTLAENGLSVDTITVADELHRLGKLNEFSNRTNIFHGHAALSLIRETGEPENALAYAHRVMEYSAKREMLELFNTGAAWAVNGRSAVDIAGDMRQRLDAIRVPHASNSRTMSISQAVSSAYDKTYRASQGETIAVPTGYPDLDNGMLNDGLYAPDLHIVAARPGQGKTSLLLSIAMNAAKAGRRTGVFTLEMGNEEISMRMIAQLSGVAFGKQRNGRMSAEEWEAYHKAIETLTNAANPYPIVMNDLPAITIGGIRRELNRMGKVDLVIVDYLQLAGVDGRYESRVREVSEISAGLKAIAKEFDVPVLAAAQLSRAVEQRTDKRPILADLRESGSIENDADFVAFIYRPDQYGPEAAKNAAELIIAKHRNGPVGKVDLVFRPEVARFESAVAKEVRF
ncbi:MAG TPA: replicative DNA helicase [Geobacteraceae bacterium]